MHEPLQVVHRELGVVDAEEQRDVAPVATLLNRKLPDLDRRRLPSAAVATGLVTSEQGGQQPRSANAPSAST